MITVTAVDIIEYRAELASNANALQALDMLEDCEGNLEDAAIALAISAGQEPDCSDQWLMGLAKRWRSRICQTPSRTTLTEAETIAEQVTLLTQVIDLPVSLVTLLAIYLVKTGVDQFCAPLDETLG
ncbi:hypothetical protein [Leptolyngbya sp. CCY15150]|jgi:hypothetical protein|uniref:hypothetical protein n=1 Tax=Leptolyngbya sp. CCY15150 TaxID=2767772 RepID=UPI00195020E4|nr:hypothetical protein [Leptolyngbya sp. CCY15150]